MARSIRFIRTTLLGGAAVGQLACGAGWRRVAPAAEGALAPRQQAQLWVSGRSVRLHGVVFRQDSVIGTGFLQPLDCDTCRLAWPVAAVDSIRIGNPSSGFWKSVGLALGATLVVAIVGCANTRGCDWYGD
jgi:hypothetical protein